MDGYFGNTTGSLTHFESQLIYIVIFSIIVGLVFILYLILDSKREVETIYREYSRDLPEGWFANLTHLIEQKAQKREIVDHSYEIYDWKHNGFLLHLYISWQDFYDGLEVFDVPILMSASITIYKTGLLKKEVFNANLDRNNYVNREKDYMAQYTQRKNMGIIIKVGGA